jgi:hypothetical protein
MMVIDLDFFQLMSLHILYILYTYGPLVEYVQALLFKTTRLDSAHVIRVGEAWPKCRGLDRSPIFWIPDLLNTVYITLKSPTREIYVSPFV